LAPIFFDSVCSAVLRLGFVTLLLPHPFTPPSCSRSVAARALVAPSIRYAAFSSAAVR